jgi:hypothetical protein
MPGAGKKGPSKNRFLIKRYGSKKASVCLAEMVRLLLENDSENRM